MILNDNVLKPYFANRQTGENTGLVGRVAVAGVALNSTSLPEVSVWQSAAAPRPRLLSPKPVPAPGPTSYLTQLDGLRFVAVLLVLVDHWLAERNKLPLGPLGVTIFFVLSGFLISRILLSSKDKHGKRPGGLGFYLRTFYIRRTLRIFPLYYLVILALALAHIPPVRETLAWNLLYATNLYIASHQSWMGSIDHFWSLAVEEQVYLFFPLLLFFVPRRHVVLTMLLMITGAVASRYVLFATGQPWMVGYVSTICCLDAFGLGGLLAYLFLYERDRFEKLFQNSALVVAALLAFVLVVAYAKTYPEVHNIQTEVWERLAGSVLGMTLVGRSAVGFTGGVKWLFEHAVCRYLGQISYGLYIFHNFVFNAYHTPVSHPTVQLWNRLAALFPPGADLMVVKLFFLFGLTTLLASASWHLFEKPINSLKDIFSY